MEEVLRSRKIRVTDFRLAVLNAFDKHPNAIDMDQLESELNDFDRITLYRTLKTFKEKGIIHDIIMPDKTEKMALCALDCAHEKEHHHHDHVHFQCSNCNEIYCIDLPEFPEIGLSGFQVDHLEIQAVGRCEHCVSIT